MEHVVGLREMKKKKKRAREKKKKKSKQPSQNFERIFIVSANLNVFCECVKIT